MSYPYDLTPDANPILDQRPAVAGLLRAAGFSGHSFKLSPVIGRRVAELVLYGQAATIPSSGSARAALPMASRSSRSIHQDTAHQ